MIYRQQLDAWRKDGTVPGTVVDNGDLVFESCDKEGKPVGYDVRYRRADGELFIRCRCGDKDCKNEPLLFHGICVGNPPIPAPQQAKHDHLFGRDD